MSLKFGVFVSVWMSLVFVLGWLIEKSPEIITVIEEWAEVGFWALCAGVLLWNLRGLIAALKGENKRWDMADIAQMVVLGLTIYIIIKEGNRQTEARLYSDFTVGILLGGVLILAKLEKALEFVLKLRGQKGTSVSNESKG